MLRVWESEELLNCKINYAAFARRLPQVRLGCSCDKYRGGMCHMCACWDAAPGPQLETFYKDPEKHLRANVQASSPNGT